MKEYRKLMVAVVTTLSEAVTLGLIEGDGAKWVTLVIAGAGAFGVYAIRNGDRPPDITVTER